LVNLKLLPQHPADEMWLPQRKRSATIGMLAKKDGVEI
jgi:hypothetical protein